MGGEIQRGSLTHDTGYSKTVYCTGKSSYLEPISGSMQKPIEGEVAIGEKHNKNQDEKAARTYLERIRNRMNEPIEGLLAGSFSALNKGGVDKREQQFSSKTHSLEKFKTNSQPTINNN